MAGSRLRKLGHALGRGEAAFTYRVAEIRPRSRTQSDAADTADVAYPALLAALKAERLRLARERQVPAFVIFSDRTLIDMAARTPRDLDAFAAVHGVGASKLKDFGAVFLGVIAAHT